MRKALILTGLSGSGKSTFARQFCVDHPNYIRVNRDDLRRAVLPVSLAEYWQTWPEPTKNRIENLVNDNQKSLIINGLTRGWNLLIDNTTLKLSYINEFRQLFAEQTEAIEISYQLIDIPVDECIRRDRFRDDAVGEVIIRQQAEQLRMLKKNFQFQREILTRSPVFQREQDEALPRCVLVDIDGTVAQMNGRSAFAWARVGEDLPKWPVIRLVQSLRTSGYAIIFFSGRDAVCRAETTEWLIRHFNWQASGFQLFMRPQNDNRKDAIVKQELFEQHILGRYFVEFVIDDRQQVVDMWRRTLGLTCLQVDYGAF